MQKFSVLLAVNGWNYLRTEHCDLETGRYVPYRTITLLCSWDSYLVFRINGQSFSEAVTVNFRIGEPITFPEPKDLDFLLTHYMIRSGLGGGRYYPKIVNADSGIETKGYLYVDVVVSPETFAKLLENRHELKRLTLDVMAEKVSLNLDGAPCWEYSNHDENALYILGFSYVIASPQREDTGSA